ncbi:MBL fold metallo-hydrolase [Silvibacterium acidisoli]|uniref:MBL fold metallo-hydrolase n=1 Tax=Acidobacteriaceae bacterium ZG23-2 TaxID=2883246 RepID=UPI00406C5115
MISRRHFCLTGAAAAGAVSLSSAITAIAQAPVSQKSAQPGFYRFNVGASEVTVLSDGPLNFPIKTLFPGHIEEAQKELATHFLPQDHVALQQNTTLIRVGGKLVLVDAGSGPGGKFQPTAGRLLDYIAAAGYRPDQIDMVLITHGHSDHLWGISDLQNEVLLFPNAEFVADETEVKFWNSPELTVNVSPALKPDVTRANLKLAAPRLRLIKAGAEVLPGLTTISTPGHTPGHMSVLLHSGNDQLLLTSDVVVNYPVDFAHPEWPFGFDQDKPLAAKSRIAFLDRAAADRTLVSGYHLPFPGVGHIVRVGNAFHWEPASWMWPSA